MAKAILNAKDNSGKLGFRLSCGAIVTKTDMWTIE